MGGVQDNKRHAETYLQRLTDMPLEVLSMESLSPSLGLHNISTKQSRAWLNCLRRFLHKV